MSRRRSLSSKYHFESPNLPATIISTFIPHLEVSNADSDIADTI